MVAHRKTRALLVPVNAVLHEYADHLPLTIRQIFYRLVGAHGYEKTEQAYDRLIEYRRPKIDTATERKGAKAACEGHWYLEGGETARHRKWHGAAHLKGASNEPARGAAMTSGPQLTNSLLRRA